MSSDNAARPLAEEALRFIASNPQPRSFALWSSAFMTEDTGYLRARDSFGASEQIWQKCARHPTVEQHLTSFRNALNGNAYFIPADHLSSSARMFNLCCVGCDRDFSA